MKRRSKNLKSILFILSLISLFWLLVGVRADEGSLVQLNGLSPEMMIVGDVDANGNDDVIADFGASYGIWVRYDDGSWVQLHGFSPEMIIVGDVDANGNDDVIADFGASYGIWVRYDDGSWVQLHGFSPEIMTVGDVDANENDDVIADFGASYGIWVRYDDGSWVQLHALICEGIITGTLIPDDSITLAWDPPTSYTDGTPLRDIDRYTIHYGISPGKFTHVIPVGNVSTCTVRGLQTGITYYFAVRVRDKLNRESGFSNEISANLK